jgi:hypothetical protein
MATSSGNSSPANKRRDLRWLGWLVLLAVLPCWWFVRQETSRPPNGGETSIVRTPGQPSTDQPSPRLPAANRPLQDALPRPTPAELADRHEATPDGEEWSLLLRLLRQELPAAPSEDDRDLADIVKARYAAHAGAAQVDELASLFHHASSMEIGQRALEILGTLQSENFQPHARSIIADPTLPADDQVVTALARALARSGTPADITLILDRIDTGKANTPSDYNGLEGLMSAVQQALAPEMEPVLRDALTRADRTWPARLAAATALQHHSTSASTQALTQAARHDADPRVAAAAAESLNTLRTPEE